MSLEQNADTVQIKKGIPGSTLKIIAIVTMLIDHIAAVVLDGYLQKVGFYERMINMFVLAPTETTMTKVIYIVDMMMRLIGRLGFPLFCFLLVEGFYFTKSRTRYAFRLFLFALISEIPFDLALGLTDNYLPEFYFVFGSVDNLGTESDKEMVYETSYPFVGPCCGFIIAYRLRSTWRSNDCSDVCFSEKIKCCIHACGLYYIDSWTVVGDYQFCRCIFS